MVSKDVSSLLRNFQSAATRLNAESDSVNETITSIEQRLVDANVGVEVWLQHALLPTDSEEVAYRETSRTIQWLGFAKLDGKWCIAVKSMRILDGFFEGDTSSPFRNILAAGDPVRLLSSSRQLRIAALQLLPDLIELLTEEAERCRRAISEASQLLTRV